MKNFSQTLMKALARDSESYEQLIENINQEKLSGIESSKITASVSEPNSDLVNLSTSIANNVLKMLKLLWTMTLEVSEIESIELRYERLDLYLQLLKPIEIFNKFSFFPVIKYRYYAAMGLELLSRHERSTDENFEKYVMPLMDLMETHPSAYLCELSMDANLTQQEKFGYIKLMLHIQESNQNTDIKLTRQTSIDLVEDYYLDQAKQAANEGNKDLATQFFKKIQQTSSKYGAACFGLAMLNYEGNTKGKLEKFANTHHLASKKINYWQRKARFGGDIKITSPNGKNINVPHGSSETYCVLQSDDSCQIKSEQLAKIPEASNNNYCFFSKQLASLITHAGETKVCYKETASLKI